MTELNNLGNQTALDNINATLNIIAKTASKALEESGSILKKTKNNIIGANINTNTNANIDDENKSKIQKQTKLIEPNRKSNHYFGDEFKNLYKGCYLDDYEKPSMEYIGEINNIKECINMGLDKNYNFVGIQQGSKCYGSNELPKTEKINDEEAVKYCNVGCNQIGKTTCGGFYYNQVYQINNQLIQEKTKIEIPEEIEANNILEEFKTTDEDFNKINIGLKNLNYTGKTPINSMVIFSWLIIFLLIIFLLFEYIFKKSS